MGPFEMFSDWYKQAEDAGVVEPFAFVLSTVSTHGEPHSRVVLLRRTEDKMFYFFTNYSSLKGMDVAQNPHVAMNFHWRAPEHRQIRIQGTVAKARADISDDYFSSRPRGSQIGAWSSPQSQMLTDKNDLLSRISLFDEKFSGKDVPRPEFWGGYGITPTYFEFWQEGENRLHTRIAFSKDGEKWVQKLLAP
ncbi:MAG: pyridoxamine 5'-phosphate oxidase [Bdellovibrionaceae bacterium]|nr:pyridoxamine 5'-phosphate oxidase [Pseudobdellovibrionaceae bacterium]